MKMNKPFLNLFYILSAVTMCVLVIGPLTRSPSMIRNCTSNSVIQYKEIYRSDVEPERKKVTLVVGILTRLAMAERRNSIRLTWLQQCQNNLHLAECRFFTDELTTAKEKQIYGGECYINGGDMVFMPIRGGTSFGLRILWMINWFVEHYQFDFYLRLDDDYFLCFDRLLLELPHRPKNGLYWGYVHCSKNTVRIDEGWLILSRDIIDEVLDRYNTTLLCHPYGGQSVRLWIQNSRLNITWFDDKTRIIHGVTTYAGNGFLRSDLCNQFLALHGTYPDRMLKYWKFSNGTTLSLKENDLKKAKYGIQKILPSDKICKFPLHFNWRLFGKKYNFQPKPCKDNPTWVVSNVTFTGRENRKNKSP